MNPAARPNPTCRPRSSAGRHASQNPRSQATSQMSPRKRGSDRQTGQRHERAFGWAARESEGSGPESARRAGTQSGWLEKAQDQKSWFLSQFLVVLGKTFPHRFGRDRLNDFLDQESSIGRSRAQCRQRFAPKADWLISRWSMPDVGFQGGLEVGAAFAQPVHHRMRRRYHNCPAGAQDAAELGESGRTVAGIVNGQRADNEGYSEGRDVTRNLSRTAAWRHKKMARSRKD